MTPTPTATRSVRGLQAVLVVLMAWEAVDTLFPRDPLPLAAAPWSAVFAVVAVVAVGLAPVRPGTAAALAIVAEVASAFFPGPYGAAAVLVAAACAAAVLPRRRALGVLTLLAGACLAAAAVTREPASVVFDLGAFLLGAAIGAVVRVARARLAHGDRRVEEQARRTARALADERAALADDLTLLLREDLAAADAAVRDGAKGPREAAAAVRAARSTATAGLARLRALVATLRGGPGDLREILESAEDALVGFGHSVELEVRDATLTEPVATRLQAALTAGLARLTPSPGSTLTLWGQPTRDGARIGVRQDGAALWEWRDPARPRVPWARLGLTALGGTLALVAALAPGVLRDGSMAWLVLGLALALAPWQGDLAIGVLVLGIAPALAAAAPGPPLAGAPPAAIVVGLAVAAAVAARPAWLAAVPVAAAAGLFLPEAGPRHVPLLVVAGVFGLLGLGVGTVLRQGRVRREDQAARLVRLAREERTTRADERRALAGELHDIVAHRLTLITLQPDDAGDPDATARFVSAELAGARADLEMLVRAARVGAPGTWLAPEAAAAAVGGTLRAAGFRVRIEADPRVDACDRLVQQTVSRVLREAGTNALRYARPETECALRLVVHPDTVEVTVTSATDPDAAPDPYATGSGLLGLRERVTLLGGTFAAGPVGAPGTWTVRANLPREPRPG